MPKSNNFCLFSLNEAPSIVKENNELQCNQFLGCELYSHIWAIFFKLNAHSNIYQSSGFKISNIKIKNTLKNMNHSFTNTFGLDYARIIWIPKKIDIVEQDNEKTVIIFMI